MIKKMLIANRGEIVSRISSTCFSLGISTVSIYTEEDKASPFIFNTDETYKLPGNGVAGYMDMDSIINIALQSKADALHPGYGFLSESAQFARKVINSGLIWIGPDSELIDLMGNKTTAKEAAQKAGLQTIPGFTIKDLSDEQEIKKSASSIGYPIILKAAMGGGGKAMKVAFQEDDLIPFLRLVQNAALTLYGNSEVLAEKYLGGGRHIEIQVACDGNNAVHLYERECSVQRRNQKVIEEAPCNFLPQQALNELYDACIIATKNLGYNSIGTLEFIAHGKNFYFLEMNTRLQVEHPVTELIVGVDLVELQILLAQNKKLELRQRDITRKGHAIECRILSEDPQNNFVPSSGKINFAMLPSAPHIRHDHNIEEGMEVSSVFDSMLSKLVSFGRTREEARARMLKALGAFHMCGTKNNIQFLSQVLLSKEFISGKLDTAFLSRFKPEEELSSELYDAAFIAAVLLEQTSNTQKRKGRQENRWRALGWH